MENGEERVIFSKYQGDMLPTLEIEENGHKKHKKRYNLLGSLVYSPCLFQMKTNLSDASTAWNAVNITKMWKDAVNEQAYSEQRMSR